MDIKSLIVGQATADEGITPTGSVSITSNGTTDVTNYASADVNVPNSYSSSDEGKVVSSGALVSQTSTTKTENGTYNTTTNNEVVVNVPQPSGNINITDTNSTDVTNYATAQVIDADLVAGNIKKDVNILGVTGTYEGSGGGGITDGMIFTVSQYGGNPIVKVDFKRSSAQPFQSLFGMMNASGIFGSCQEFTFPNNMPVYSHIIPNYLFQCWENLTTINNFPWSNPTEVELQAFNNCKSLSFSTIQTIIDFSGVQTIGSNTFAQVGSYLTQLAGTETVTFGSGISSIASRAFSNCITIKTVYFNGTPSTLNAQTFYTCSNITDIYVPWSEGAVANAPWGATNATIHYNYTA